MPVVELMPDGQGQAVRLGRGVDVGEQCAGLDAGGAGRGVDRHVLHGREIEHQAAVADGIAADIVAAALDRGEQPVLGGEADRALDVGGRPAAHDEARLAVDHGVPDGPRLVVAGVARGDRIAVEPVAQTGERSASRPLVPASRVASVRLVIGSSSSIADDPMVASGSQSWYRSTGVAMPPMMT